MQRVTPSRVSIRRPNPVAKALRNGALRPQIVKSKRIYKRKDRNNLSYTKECGKNATLD